MRCALTKGPSVRKFSSRIGRLHVAKGSPKAKEYFEKVAKWGDGDLAAEAKRRLGT